MANYIIKFLSFLSSFIYRLRDRILVTGIIIYHHLFWALSLSVAIFFLFPLICIAILITWALEDAITLFTTCKEKLLNIFVGIIKKTISIIQAITNKKRKGDKK